MMNVWYTDNKLSEAWLGELLSDWSKRLFDSQDLVRGNEIPYFKGRLNFTKLNVKYQSNEI